jgi:sugar-phosphatase
LLGAKRLGVEPERCVVIEDAPAGIEAGRTAGMRVIEIHATHTPEELLEKGANVVAARLTDLEIQNTTGKRRLLLQVVSAREIRENISV